METSGHNCTCSNQALLAPIVEKQEIITILMYWILSFAFMWPCAQLHIYGDQSVYSLE